MFFLSLFCNCHVKGLLASYSVWRERQNSAGAKCCGGEEGVCVEMCACKVSAGRNTETAEPVIIISHLLTSLPNVWILSFFVLLPPGAFTFPFMWQAAQQKHQSLFVNVSCRWPSILNCWTVLNSVLMCRNHFAASPPFPLVAARCWLGTLFWGGCCIVITAAVYEVMKGNTCCWHRSVTCESVGDISKY